MALKQIYLVLPLEQVNEPDIPIRTDMDHDRFNELCESIKDIGLIEPIVVKKKGKKYEVVAGHRRLLACKALNLGKINCVLVGTKDADMEVVKFAENVVREDVHPIDEAVFLDSIMNRDKIKVEDLADMINKSTAYVWERLQILEYPVKLKEAFKNGVIRYSAARELFKIKDEVGLEQYLQHTIESGASSGVVKRWVLDYNSVTNVENIERVENIEGAGGSNFKPVQVVCDICNKSSSLDMTRVVRLCLDCHSKIISSG